MMDSASMRGEVLLIFYGHAEKNAQAEIRKDQKRKQQQ